MYLETYSAFLAQIFLAISWTLFTHCVCVCVCVCMCVCTCSDDGTGVRYFGKETADDAVWDVMHRLLPKRSLLSECHAASLCARNRSFIYACI